MKPSLLMLPSAVSNSRVHNILPNKIETDFQFSRASAATRVNHQGLIENVGYFSNELIQNGNFNELGPELITNGDFTTDSNWTKQTGWSIINGKAVADLAFAQSLNQAFSGGALTSGKIYKTVFTVSDYVTGNLKAQLSGGGSAQDISGVITANGTYTFYTIATNNATGFRFKGLSQGGGFTGKIDNVSIKQVDPDNDWLINGDWEYVNNGISVTNATGTYNDSALYQFITLDSSKQYKATIDVSSISGSLQVYTGLFSSGFTINTTGVKSFILDLTSAGGRVNLLPGNGSDVVIKSFSLVEVIGDKPRLDYDPINPTCPHLLLEPQSTNLVGNSNASFITNGTSISYNNITSPDGTQNGFKVQSTTTGTAVFARTGNIGFTDPVTFSAFVKYGNNQWLQFLDSNTAAHFFNFDVQNGVFGTSGSGTTNLKAVKFANGWYRVSGTFTGVSASATFRIYVNDRNDAAYGSAVSSAIGQYFYAFGWQVENLAFSTSYIPTAGAAETRVQETCTNAGNINTFNSAEGVLYAEIAHLAPAASYSNQSSFSISDGTTNNRIIIYRTTSNNNIISQVRVAGVIQANEAYVRTIEQSTEFSKIAFKYETNKFRVFGDGNLVATDTSGSTLPADTLKNLSFNIGTNGNEFYGKVKGLATYNRALTDNELYTITSTQYSAYSGMVAALGNYTIPC